MQRRREEIVERIRHRLLAAVGAGVLKPGDRLASTRELAVDFNVDPRVVSVAYQLLANQGLVELRERSGIFVAASAGAASAGGPAPEDSWVASVLAEGVERGLPAPALAGWLSRRMESAPISAAAIATTVDQTSGLCRELRNDYGLDCRGVSIEALLSGDATALADVREVTLLVTTKRHAAAVGQLAAELGKPCIAVDIRPDLVGREWMTVLRDRVHVVLVDPRFADLLSGFMRSVPGATNLRPIVVGRDDVGAIPDDAPVYVTQAARCMLGDVRVPGRVLEPTRVLSSESARAILLFTLRAAGPMRAASAG